MVGCSAVNCSNSTAKGFRIFRFPSDPCRRSKWVKNMRRENWLPTNNTRLCEAHFEYDQFENFRADGHRKLKPNAVPTIFQNRPELLHMPPASTHENNAHSSPELFLVISKIEEKPDYEVLASENERLKMENQHLMADNEKLKTELSMLKGSMYPFKYEEMDIVIKEEK